MYLDHRLARGGQGAGGGKYYSVKEMTPRASNELGSLGNAYKAYYFKKDICLIILYCFYEKQ